MGADLAYSEKQKLEKCFCVSCVKSVIAVLLGWKRWKESCQSPVDVFSDGLIHARLLS